MFSNPEYLIEQANPARRRMPLMRSSQGGDRFTNADGPLSISFRVTVICPDCDAKQIVSTPTLVLTAYPQGSATNDHYLLMEHGRAASMVLWRRCCEECGVDMRISNEDRDQVREMFSTLKTDIEADISNQLV